MVVRQRTCLGCGRTLTRGKALRCGRCRDRRIRESDAKRRRAGRAAPREIVRELTAPSPEPAESPWRDANGRPISPDFLPALLHDHANRPPIGSPEWRDLRASLEAYAESLPEDHPLVSEFLGLLEYDFPLPSPAATVGAAPTPIDEEEETPEFVPRRLEVAVADLNENDLLAWIPDPTWDDWSRRTLVSELKKREASGRVDPRNRDAIRRVLGTVES